MSSFWGGGGPDNKFILLKSYRDMVEEASRCSYWYGY